MVKLNKIYTRTGDDGTTGLGTGERRLKSDLRVDAYGTVDEANACIGMARIHTGPLHPAIDAMLAGVQNDLFDLGADLSVPDTGELTLKALRDKGIDVSTVQGLADVDVVDDVAVVRDACAPASRFARVTRAAGL